MNIGQVYSTEIVGFVIIGILLFKFKMPKAGLLSIALAIVYPLASYYFGEVKHWISFGDANYGDLMFTSLFPRIAFIVPIILIVAIIMFFLKGFKIGGILLGLAGAIGFTFYGLYKWEQNLIDIFSKSSIVNFFEWETFFLVFGVGILLIFQMRHKKSPDNNDISGRVKRNPWITRGFIVLISVFCHWGVSLLSHKILLSLLVIPFILVIGLFIGEPTWNEWMKKILFKPLKISPRKLEFRSNTFITRVYITKLPQLVQKTSEIQKKSLGSLMQDFGKRSGLNNRKYFMQFLSENGVQIQIGTFTKTQVDAEIAAREIEHGLRNSFPSINLESKIEKIEDSDFLLWGSPIVEVKLPKAPYSNIIPLLKNITQLTKHSGDFRVLIQFQETVRSESDKVIRLLERLLDERSIDLTCAKEIAKRWNNTNLFRIKIFYQQKNTLQRTKEDLNDSVFGRLLTKDILSLTNYFPKLSLVSNLKLHLRRLISNRMNFSTLVSPKIVDFHLDHKLTIRRSKSHPSTNFVSKMDLMTNNKFEKFIDGDILRAIKLGNAILDGEGTNDEVYLPIDILRQHLSIFGLTRTGKSTLLTNLLHKVKKIDRSVSFLIFGLKDGVDIAHYKPDKIYTCNSSDFNVPWVCLAKNSDGAKLDLENLASYLAAAMGLLDNTQRYIKIIIMNIIREGKKLPRDFGTFMSYILKYLEDNPYGESQGDIFQAIRDHILALSEERFLQVTQASETIPKWFEDWILNKSENNGKTIYIDLRGFGITEQRFIVLSIFHMIQRYAEPDEGERLRRLLLIDEAHILFYPPKVNNYQDSDSIGQQGVDKFLRRLLKELGVTGTGLVFADQDVQSVLPIIVQQTSTKILFRNSRESAKEFTHNPVLIDEIYAYDDHVALLQAGPIGESVVFSADVPVYLSKSSSVDLINIQLETLEHTKFEIGKLELEEYTPIQTSNLNLEIKNQCKNKSGRIEQVEISKVEKLLEEKKYGEAFFVDCDLLFDQLILRYREFPSNKFREEETFIRNGKKDIMLLIEACQKSISERFIQISDDYDDGIVSIIQDFGWVIEDVLDGCYMNSFHHYTHAKKYIKRIETVITGYFSSLEKIRRLDEKSGLTEEFWKKLKEFESQFEDQETLADPTSGINKNSLGGEEFE